MTDISWLAAHRDMDVCHTCSRPYAPETIDGVTFFDCPECRAKERLARSIRSASQEPLPTHPRPRLRPGPPKPILEK